MATENAQAEAAPNTDQPTAPAATSGTVEVPSPLSTFDYDAINAGFQNSPAPETNPVAEQGDPKAGETQNGEEKPAPKPAPAEAVRDEEVDTNNLPDKLRARFSDPEDIAIATLARAKGISLSKAADIYREQHPAPKEIPGTEAQAPEVSPESAEVQRIQGEVDTLAAEIEEAEKGEDYLTPDHFKKTRKLANLEADLRQAKRDEARAKAQATQTQQDTAEQSRLDTLVQAQAANHQEMVGKYPALNDAESPLAKGVAAVVAEWRNDPKQIDNLRQPDAALRVVREAVFRNPKATEAAAAPSPKPAPAPAPATPPAPAPAVRRVSPAPGSQTQANPGQSSTPAALLKDVGFDPDKAGEALYGDSKKAALIG